MKTFLLVATLGGLLVLTLVGSSFIWWSMGGIDISLHGMIALTLGCLFSLLLGGGLMFLVFYSSRRGHDDEHHRGPEM